MEGEGYRRARLCRLCECPVVDGGVRLQEQHLDKLSRWWKAYLDTDLQLEQKHCIICHFCVWDLRFADQHSEENRPDDQTWWTNHKKKNNLHNYFKYYSDELMKPCLVKINQIPNEKKLLHEYRQVGFGHRCLYCPQSYADHDSWVNHSREVHPEKVILCDVLNCDKPPGVKCKLCKKIFKSKEERDKHFAYYHNSREFFCCFCDRYFKCYKTHWCHMQYHHKEALKCNAVHHCPNYFKTEEDRQKHVLEEHKEKYKCIFCNLSFQIGYSLTTHVKRNHKDALYCEYTHFCSTWFKTEEERQKHYEEKHESGDDKVQCPLCDKKFSKLGIIQSHFKIHHKKEKLIKCNYMRCANYFSSEEDKLKHVKEVHEIYDEKFRCLYCGKFILKNLKDHIAMRHKEVAIRCNVHKTKCATYFKTVEDRDKHVKEVHQAEKIRKPFSCLYCDQVVPGKDNLNTHVRAYHAKIAVRCQKISCRTYFKSQDELEKHLSLFPNHREISNKKDADEPKKKYRCAQCSRSFRFKSNYNQHLKVKHGEIKKEMCPHCRKPISKKEEHIISDFCKVCNKKFPCLALFWSHTLKCRPVFQCPVCSKSFKIECRLTYHCKINHTVPIFKWKGLQNKNRGFKCDECFTYLSSKQAHKAHMKLHEGTSKLTCDTCKKQLSSIKNLTQHIKVMHLGLRKIFPCSVCNKKLGSEIALRKHVQNKCDKYFVQCPICAKIMEQRAVKGHIQRNH